MQKSKKRRIKEYGFILSIWIYPAVLFLVMYIGVNINSFALAFQKTDAVGAVTFVGFENFIEIFQNFAGDTNVLRTALKNSLLMYIICLTICMPLYIIFSYYIFKKWFASKVIRTIVMIPAVVSGFIICLLFRKFVELALPNLMRSLTGKPFPQLLNDPRYSFGTTLFYMIWISFSTSLIVYPNAMSSIDDAIIDSGKMDGVNSLQELWYIILPLIFPTISTFLITGVAGIFSASGPLVEFYMYSAPPETINLGYYIFRETMKEQNSYSNYNFLAAMGLVLTIFSVPLTFIAKAVLGKLDPSEAQ